MDHVGRDDNAHIEEGGTPELENPFDKATPLLNLRNRSPKTGSRRSPDEVTSLHLTNVSTQDKVDLEKYESDDVKPSLCQDILTRILILLYDTDLENACHAILRRRGRVG